MLKSNRIKAVLKMNLSSSIKTLMLCPGLAFFLSGCVVKPYMTEMSIEKQIRNDVVGKYYYVEGRVSWASPSAGYNIKTRNIHIIQNAADLTLNEGYSYFSIARPFDISTLEKNSIVTTAQEFIDKCTPPEGQIFDVGNMRCGFNGTSATAGVIIAVFKERPLSFLSYDAKDVKGYLKANEMYRDDSYEKDIARSERVMQKYFPDYMSFVTE